LWTVGKSNPAKSMEAATERSDATTPDRRGSFIALRVCGSLVSEAGPWEVRRF
jgi:hypothetical protein